MPPIYIFEDSHSDRLYPLTYSRAQCQLRCGAFTLLERMQKTLLRPVAGVFVRPELADTLRPWLSVPVNPPISTGEGVILLNARWLMTSPWTEPNPNSAGLELSAIAWLSLDSNLAGTLDFSKILEPATLEKLLPKVTRKSAHVTLIDRPWDLITHNSAAICADFGHFGAEKLGKIYPGAHFLEEKNIHIAEGVKIYPGAVLDAEKGPIILDKSVEVRPQAVVTGPVYVGEGSLIRTFADIREGCSFGPGSRVGGEVMGSIFLGNANKQHDGFLGQSVVGEWANLGAGTTTSNLKNTYGNVRMPINGTEEGSGQLFLGSVIGDHAKLGIGTYLSTGSVVGFGSHVTGGRPPKFVPSFGWLTEKGIDRADFEKIEKIAKTVMGRRNREFTAADHELFVRIASEWSQREAFDWDRATAARHGE